MEDALISPEGFMILSGAGLVEASASKPVYQHVTEKVDANDVVKSTAVDGANTSTTVKIPLSKNPYLPTDKGDNFAYVMFMRDGVIVTEPYIPMHGDENVEIVVDPATGEKKYVITVAAHDCYNDFHDGETDREDYVIGQIDDIKFDSVMVDFYVAHEAAAQQIEITPEQFGGNFYLEASTLFRNKDGVDMPAEFIIPNCKIQSNFTFTMASSGDPSSFTFTIDAFPDYTRFDHSKKVFAAIQIIEEESAQDLHRGATPNGEYDVSGVAVGIDPHEDLYTDRINAAP